MDGGGRRRSRVRARFSSRFACAALLGAFVVALVPVVCQAQPKTAERAYLSGRSNATSAPPSATRLLAAADKDALAAHWVTLQVEAHSSGTRGLYNEQVGPGSGYQVLTIDKSVATIAMLVGNTAYLKSSERFLRQLGVAKAEAAKISNRWISVPSTDRMFQQFVGGLTITGALDGTLPLPPLTMGAKIKQGNATEQVIEGRLPAGAGGGSGSATIWVTLGAHPLPARASVDFGHDSGLQTTFGKWGDPLRVTAPKKAIPAASLGL